MQLACCQISSWKQLGGSWMFGSRAQWGENSGLEIQTWLSPAIKWQMRSLSHSLASFYSDPTLLTGSVTSISSLYPARLCPHALAHLLSFPGSPLSPRPTAEYLLIFLLLRKNLRVLSTIYVTNNFASYYNPNLHLIFAYLKILRKQQQNL